MSAGVWDSPSPASTEEKDNPVSTRGRGGHIFLKVAHMANQGLQKEITFQSQGKNKIDAIVQFRRGDSVKGKFQFMMEDVSTGIHIEKKIKDKLIVNLDK